jgi:hypothetical protein
MAASYLKEQPAKDNKIPEKSLNPLKPGFWDERAWPVPKASNNPLKPGFWMRELGLAPRTRKLRMHRSISLSRTRTCWQRIMVSWRSI